MIDLSSREEQTRFKRMQRVSLGTTLLMVAVTIVCASIAIWSAVNQSRAPEKGWAEILFIVLLCLIAVAGAGTLVWEIKNLKPFNASICRFVAQGFVQNEKLTECGEMATFNLFIAGDKLTVLREENGAAVQLDLTPVMPYANVCYSVVRRTREYLKGYYGLHAQSLGCVSAQLTDAVGRKPKTVKIVEDGLPYKPVNRNYFIKHGLIV